MFSIISSFVLRSFIADKFDKQNPELLEFPASFAAIFRKGIIHKYSDDDIKQMKIDMAINEQAYGRVIRTFAIVLFDSDEQNIKYNDQNEPNQPRISECLLKEARILEKECPIVAAVFLGRVLSTSKKIEEIHESIEILQRLNCPAASSEIAFALSTLVGPIKSLQALMASLFINSIPTM